MPLPRLLVVEGNTANGRALYRAAGGSSPSDGYASLLRELAPDAIVDICYPADAGANLPDGAGLEAYDGVAITGSSLNIYNGGLEIDRQIELARAVLASGTPLFGSCWGLQVLTTAAGGTVRKNPNGREIGFARRIALTAAGRGHPMYESKAEAFDAMTVHLDEIEALAPGMQVLAANAMSQVQAAELRVNGATAWGVQYHPEYSLHDMAVTIRRYGKRMVDGGFLSSEAEVADYAQELEILHGDPHNRSLAWKHGIDGAVLDKAERVRELENWIAYQVLPMRAKRGRG
jgi:GMP synthase (glutamine-hydrolysing)